ncbi:hypothetical protein RF11_05924 [Thelohanellus kitauei]|uniref:Uncharacterized protein n=1 Tax=Thelohanellus kitauei TaxID=669202 RepID=A0A0C2IWU7_THEKT|nr:hypothetical protein RF11_05924 [Thelohanellus kitauei]
MGRATASEFHSAKDAQANKRFIPNDYISETIRCMMESYIIACCFTLRHFVEDKGSMAVLLLSGLICVSLPESEAADVLASRINLRDAASNPSGNNTNSLSRMELF